MSTETPSRRQTKPADERRQEILEAALALFDERGFDATTVQSIASAAGVAAGTVYLYFPSKEHVLQALHARFHAGMQAQIEETAAEALRRMDSPNKVYGWGIDAMVDGVVGYVLEHQQETAVICRFLPRMNDELVREGREMGEFVAGVIKAGVDAGSLHVSDPEMTGQLLTAALRDAMLQSILTGHPDDLPRIGAQAKELFRKALAPQAPAES